MMAYNPAYYTALIESAGLAKVKDLYAWQMTDQNPPEHLLRAEKLVGKRYKITVRTLDTSRFDEELAIVRRLYNSAWEKNWGFVPMSDHEIDHMADELRHILDPQLALFVETPAGEPIGFALALPDFNQILKRMNGKLFPLGILKALIYKGRITSMRVLILGLIEEWRGKGIDTLLYLALIRNGAARGITMAEQSWILEDNEKMNAAIKRLGGRMYRTYRVYEASL
jgi:GNAT superfamily N-acetyltransferase